MISLFILSLNLILPDSVNLDEVADDYTYECGVGYLNECPSNITFANGSFLKTITISISGNEEDEINITLNKVIIDGSFKIKGLTARIILEGENQIGANENDHSMIECRDDATIIFEGNGTLNIQSSPSESKGAGIGTLKRCKEIRINEGKYLIYGGKYGAGIGTGKGDEEDNYLGAIVINGGEIDVYGGDYGAGIGGGCGEKNATSNVGVINITGGKIKAIGGMYGAGIGGGFGGKNESRTKGYSSCVGEINIDGGEVIAHGGTTCPGIGGGYGASRFSSGVESITFNSGNVTAFGGIEYDPLDEIDPEYYYGLPGIGNGYAAYAYYFVNDSYESSIVKKMTFNGGDILAIGGYNESHVSAGASGIGTQYDTISESLTFKGGSIKSHGLYGIFGNFSNSFSIEKGVTYLVFNGTEHAFRVNGIDIKKEKVSSVQVDVKMHYVSDKLYKYFSCDKGNYSIFDANEELRCALSVGAIVGIVIACLAFIGIVVVIVVVCKRCKGNGGSDDGVASV